ncbi:hypothetical protein ATANTOWER_017396 [Ataeniobius toweri]|uniref:BED-type domain-containing protein n=1 Tax=Ataeniobius toweri TaxID=208326 RepID=A0ABU7BNF4_9TELE|nr:hypothetical protein [Ataeniobius toweri]
MPDMNTALHAEERNDVSSCWSHQQSMADRKRSKVWDHFSECDADYARYNICDGKCKASGGNTSNLRKHLVKCKIFLKAEECTVFHSLRSTATTPAFSTVTTPSSMTDSWSATSNMGEEMFETTEILHYKQLDVVLIHSLKFVY